MLVGTLYGAIAGYFGGRLDSAMMRFVDILYSIPFMFILILLLIIFGRSFMHAVRRASGWCRGSAWRVSCAGRR